MSIEKMVHRVNTINQNFAIAHSTSLRANGERSRTIAKFVSGADRLNPNGFNRVRRSNSSRISNAESGIKAAGVPPRHNSGAMESKVEPLTKPGIRSKILLRLKTHKEEDRNRRSKVIKEKLLRTLVFKKAKVVLFYISFGGEVNTKDMIKEASSLGKIVAVPVCRKNRSIRPCVISGSTRLIRGLYELYEPAIKKFINLEDLDLVIVPGIAFDKKGNRLGRGKGYYDRFLSRLPRTTVSIGLAFGFQILPSIPTTNEDKKVDRVIFA